MDTSHKYMINVFIHAYSCSLESNQPDSDSVFGMNSGADSGTGVDSGVDFGADSGVYFGTDFNRFQKTSELAGIDSDKNFIFPITKFDYYGSSAL